MVTKARVKPVVLTILDGWGYREDSAANAIAIARTPVWDRLWREYPHTLISTSGGAVGLPGDQMGNSEVGHLNLGAGRVVYQELTRVGHSIDGGDFFRNPALTSAVDLAAAEGKAVHILGLLSPGGVHSHEDHLQAMARLAAERGVDNICLHAFLDGRDMPPKSAGPSLEAMQQFLETLGKGRIASIIGRYYAMDRDKRWERVRVAYDMLTRGQSDYRAADALTALEKAYQRGESDEFVKATCILPAGGQAAKIEDGDVVVFMNFRADRARELTQAFIDEAFEGFERAVCPRLAAFVSLTRYKKEFDIPVAFPPEKLQNLFGEYVSSLGYRQLRLAETEKYAHVTFFFNGGREKPFQGEERILVPSPKVDTYDHQPEMSAEQVTDHLVAAIESGKYDVIICNFANPDMVGHTGVLEAAVKAVETIDRCLGRVEAALKAAGGEMLVTADHGNVEQMVDETTGQPHTAHTNNPVPLLYLGERQALLNGGGSLCDIAPTLLKMMDLKQPADMQGKALVAFAGEAA